MPRHHFQDLATVVDDVHAFVDRCATDGTLTGVLDLDSVEVLRLAIHEWVANLVQHAIFPGPVAIDLELAPEGDTVRCSVEDSSTGFEFERQIEHQQALLDAPAPSERGRGLLMLVTCADDLTFRPAAPGTCQAVSFRVRSATVQPRLAGLFRAEDFGDSFGDSAPLEPLPSLPPAAGAAGVVPAPR